MTRTERDDLAERLDRFWEGMLRYPSAPNGRATETDLADTVRLLHTLDRGPDPDPAFRSRLRAQLVDRTRLAPVHAGIAARPAVEPIGEERSRTSRGSRSRGSLGHTGWWSKVNAVAVALLVLAVVGALLAGGLLSPRQRGATTPPPEEHGDVPMLLGNPSRTGELPGPGPAGELGLLWRTYVGGVDGSPAVVDGVLYLPGDGHYLYAIDAATGKRLWRAETSFAHGSSPAVADGVVYVGDIVNTEGPGQIGSLRAIDAATGKELWRAATGGSYGSSPAVAAGTVYVAGGSADLFAFDAATGHERWRFALGPTRCRCAPISPAVHDDLVIVGNDEGTLFAIDAASGREQWRFQTGTTDRLSNPSVADGTVYAIDAGGILHAIGAEAGEPRRQLDLDPAPSPILAPDVPASLAVVDGAIYAASRDGNLQALDAATGRERWAMPVGGAPLTTPVVADGVVYLGGADGFVTAVNAATGQEQWQIDVGSAVRGSPVVVDGALYVGTVDGLLFAIVGDEAASAATPIGDGDLTGREPCTAEPRPDPIAAGSNGTSRTSIDARFTIDSLVPEDRLPQGPPPPAATVAGISATAEALARCARGDRERVYSFFSADLFRRLPEPPSEGPALSVILPWGLSPFAEIVVRDARVLADGRVGAIVEGGFNPAFVVFVTGGDGWLIDEIVVIPFAAEADDLGTPSPSAARR